MELLGIIFSGLSMAASVLIFITVKFNDIKHIQIAVEKIEKTVADLGKTMSSEHENTQKELQSVALVLKGITVRCRERHEIKRKVR